MTAASTTVAIPRRRVNRWQVLIGAGFVVSALFLVAGLAGACYLVANGVGYVLAHAWWNQ